MRAFHDSRDYSYRQPYGALSLGETVKIFLDVYDAPDITVFLRTWTDYAGEQLLQMAPIAPDENQEADAPVRYAVAYLASEAGPVWYHFIISFPDGTEKRYGVVGGRRGGKGQLCDWEPPSFKLYVQGMSNMPPAWYEPVAGYLYDGAACHDMEEVVATIRENYPTRAFLSELPWATGQENGDSPHDVHVSDLPSCPHFENAGSGCFSLNDDVFGFWRASKSNNPVCVLLNKSVSESHDISVPMAGEAVSELICGYDVHVRQTKNSDRFADVRLTPLGAVILHFHPVQRLQEPLQPGLGVLAHVTSLPCDGTSSLGAPARAFVDWLAESGVKYWQVLPANPTDEYGSPYAGISAFAGNTLLLDGDIEDCCALSRNNPWAYHSFCEREADWLLPYARFMAIRDEVGAGIPWQDWPACYQDYDLAISSGESSLQEGTERWMQLQFAFDQQWKALRAYANAKGVRIIGDMPIYVSADSADVWSNPGLFQLGSDGLPAVVAGCPPDAFAVDGQVWGNPLYDWDVCRQNGFSWWIRRLQRAFELYDVVRLDHFIGFTRYFSIPTGQKASTGAYRTGPGFDLFQKAFDEFGPLPLVAEDLGLLTPSVRALVAECGFPGMDVVQFADGGNPLESYQPRPEKIVYTGTHDNQTLVGFCQDRYPGHDAVETADKIMRKTVVCKADVCIVPLQDLMDLDDEARMNVPGVAEGNWAWKADADAMDDAADKLNELVALRQKAIDD